MSGLIIDSFAGGGGASTGMKLGSLFDGSGGFPLAGAIHGITPMWASEIEAYPIRVTKARFPKMEHLGSVLDVNGAEIEPVDIITFGSPCQDLSVAGKQAGLHKGERSNLFFEAIRIIKEMREATDGIYPRIAVWENVPGAYSSNKGEDFRAVLQAFCQVCDPTADVPMPPKKWHKSGAVVGNGWSVAWRTFDAQFWGVPQRRKRIYLIADFGSERAGEVLFEQESVRGDSAESGTAGESAAGDAEGSVGRGGVCYALQGNGIDRADTAGCNGAGWREGECYTLNTIDRPAVCYPAADAEGSAGRGGVCYQDKVGALCSTDYKWVQQQQVMQDKLVVQRMTEMGPSAVCYAIDSLSSNSMKSPNPNSGFHEEEIAKCLDTSGGNPACNQGGNVIVETKQVCADGISPTLPGQMGTGGNNGPMVLETAKPPRKYIIRRLTPLECCRLQGFPDWWEDDVQGSDSARYKMWGNGIALPNAAYVIGCAKKLIQGEHHGRENAGKDAINRDCLVKRKAVTT